jgi:hypothetical protein
LDDSGVGRLRVEEQPKKKKKKMPTETAKSSTSEIEARDEAQDQASRFLASTCVHTSRNVRRKKKKYKVRHNFGLSLLPTVSSSTDNRAFKRTICFSHSPPSAIHPIWVREPGADLEKNGQKTASRA